MSARKFVYIELRPNIFFEKGFMEIVSIIMSN